MRIFIRNFQKSFTRQRIELLFIIISMRRDEKWTGPIRRF